MQQPAGLPDRGDIQRVVEQHEVGAATRGEAAAVGEADRAGRREGGHAQHRRERQAGVADRVAHGVRQSEMRAGQGAGFVHQAAVAQRGVYNLISMRGVTDIPFFNDRESGTTPWDDVAALWRMSPVALAPDVQTPLLLEHSEQDYRVPISQAEELYLALRSFKKVVELIRWPREGHELSRSGEPKHRVERIRRIVQWFDQYTALSPFGIVKS